MNNKMLLSLSAATLAMGCSVNVVALETSANVALVSDYLFRGVSQTNERGAIQGGFDFSADSGLYAGIWASNVNYGTETSTEMDYYGGYAWESGDYEFDAGVIYYDYEGDSEFDYQEFAFSFALANFTVGFYYSPEYLGEGGPRLAYPYVDYGLQLTEELQVSFHVGLSDMDEEGLFELGEDSYMDYSIGLSWTLDTVDMSVTWTDTTIDDLDAADGRVVFSFSKTL